MSIKTGNWEQTRNWGKSVNAKGGATAISDNIEVTLDVKEPDRNAGVTDVVSLHKNESIGGGAVHRKMSAHDGASYRTEGVALESSNRRNLANSSNRNW